MAGVRGRSGRKPTPVDVLKMQGRFDDRFHAGNVEFPEGMPECPEWLGDVGKRYFNETVELLSQIPALLSPADRDAIAMYASAWELYHSCLEKMRSKSLKPSERNHASVMARGQQVTIQKMIHFFGMSPSARATLKIPGASTPKTEDDPMAELMRKRGG